MMCRVRAPYALVLAAALPAAVIATPAGAGSDLPEVKVSASNTVPECATPGRLTAFLKARNKSLAPKFETIAADYMRVGEELGIRWDTAFFQMLLETGNLTFTGDVSPDQNNFAGLGATGKHEGGEKFPDVATGVKAHLQHLMLYAGEPVDSPVAERTRKVQEWGVLTSWQKSLSGPMTYDKLAKKWAPGSRTYARDIGNVADSFYDGACKAADPAPEMMALVHPDAGKAKAGKTVAAAKDAEPAAEPTGKVSGAELARRAVAEARANGSFVRSSLGAGSLVPKDEAPAVGEPADKAGPAFKLLNGDTAAASPAAPAAQAAAAAPAEKPAVEAPAQKVQTAALGAGTKPAVTTAPAAKALACKVWTASYGGTHAVIIRARADQQDNFTVLDVNEASSKREADAYIAAYAKGGETVGEFSNSAQALEKAFELCPEG